MAGRFHDTLVIFSVMVSIIASFTAFDLIDRILSAGRRTLKFTIYASFMMGIGIWSMHFVGMLALHLDVPVTFHLPMLLLSVLLPIIAAFMALSTITGNVTNKVVLMAGGLFVGLAVVAMHYTSMMSMEMPARLTELPSTVAAAILIALAISFTCLYLSIRFKAEGRKHIPLSAKITGALLLGLAIASMHFTAIAGAVITPMAGDTRDNAHPIGNSALAVLVGGTTLFLLGFVLVGAFVDRYRALRLAADQEQRYMLLFEHSPDMVICYDPTEKRIVNANPAVYSVTGYSKDELARLTWRQLFESEQDLAAIREYYQNAVHADHPRKMEFTIISRDGRALLLSANSFPLFADGKPYVYSIARDITEQKKAELELLRAKEDAENANRVKGEFLAIMSHEVRTPLNGIVGINQLLMETELSDKQREMLLIQERSGQALLRVINDVLDFSKIESGTVTLSDEPFHLAGCLEQCIEAFSGTALQKGIELVHRIDDQIPGLLQGDPVRLSQIVLNLVGNAVKFTESGSVTLEARLTEPPDKSEAPEAVIEFIVKDTGIGIDPSRIHLLFLPFSQVLDSSKGRNYEGTGLGLAICRNLVELMGGEIWVEAGRKKGAAFGFRIPFRMLESEQSAS
jgi:PAS domain S-box-containing protein